MHISIENTSPIWPPSAIKSTPKSDPDIRQVNKGVWLEMEADFHDKNVEVWMETDTDIYEMNVVIPSQTGPEFR